MSAAPHYVIIGAGAAGNEAAWHLRRRSPESRITIITAGRMLFIYRYELPRVLEDVEDWRELLVHRPDYYDKQRIKVRRNSFVTSVDPSRRIVRLGHKEDVTYDKLLVASGGSGHLPEDLRQFAPLMRGFATFRDAVLLRRDLPEKGGDVVILGGDVLGLDIARNLIRTGRRVTLVADDKLFWPHDVTREKIPEYVSALKSMGIEVVQDRTVTRVEEGKKGPFFRRVVLDGGDEIECDVVMPFFGLTPTLGFMAGAGGDIERGLLVNPTLRTTDGHIWAAGDVCQIWSKEDNRYRFYYGWKNVKEMGRIAAHNMTGGRETVGKFEDAPLVIKGKTKKTIYSPFWEYD